MQVVRVLAVVSMSLAGLCAATSQAQAPAPAQAPAASKAPAKPAPAKSTIHDFVMLKNGRSINGNVKVNSFTLKTEFGTLTLKKSDILAVEYRKPPNKMEDEVQVSAGTRLSGDLQPTPVPVDVDDSGNVLNIPKSDILAIMFQRPIEDVSPAVKDALAKRK